MDVGVSPTTEETVDSLPVHTESAFESYRVKLEAGRNQRKIKAGSHTGANGEMSWIN